MAEKQSSMSVSEVAKPVHIQRLEKSLDLGPFVFYFEQTISNSVIDDDSSSSDDCDQTFNSYEDFTVTNADSISVDKSKLYNFSNVNHDRQLLQNILLESSDSSEQSSDEVTKDDYLEMLRHHAIMKKYKKKYYNNKDNIQYQYYSAGILSNYDKYPEHQKCVSGVKKKKREKYKRRDKKLLKRMIMKQPKELEDTQDDSYLNYNIDWDNELPHFKDEFDDDMELKNGIPLSKKKYVQKNPEVIAARRRKLWILMCKKEVGKVQRAKANNHKEGLASCKKTAQLRMRYCRQKAMQSQKNMKETLWRAKRLTREMQSYWKRYDRVERETRRRMEKEGEEQRKMDVEMIEAKRQQRKLNFLITQTELYAHFMSKKLGKASPEEQLRILSQLNEEKNPRLASIDDYDRPLKHYGEKQNTS